MKLFRICPEQYLENYSGLGASFQDGARWNHPGIPVMYFSPSPAVCMLEMANYLPSPRLVPKTYRLGTYDLPDTLIDSLDHDSLPDDWDAYPHGLQARVIGTEWLQSGQNVGLLVPSAAVPSALENVVLVNPAHPQVKKLKLVASTSELFNQRAFAGLK
ncbi:RES family NAD+ phosphorylase [Parasalinivibrio latis]|uniref:RES family NAD+ phosphorylase n=1 Tax=Parasalinivibrio latis TaxID=2952610 RepID=UPI0030E57E08